ncbi:hypothetical protein TSUD_159360 [Trifolium subterraneum]|uniref:F-box associated domain-containing protein n=1 Tax=Trifolium subterraneum TaxID=3900 RepID=A0A2Z6M845_TRISU|nr:hypothetical protein TSUD_159360 [Trifolium subterraneum]
MPLKCDSLWTGSCVINDRLYVAGLACNEINAHQLGFAQVYDPKQNNWNSISQMSNTMAPTFNGFVHDGTWFLKGYASEVEVMWQAYKPETTWSPVDNVMVSGCHDGVLKVSLNGQLYTLEYLRPDGEIDSWGIWRLNIYNRATDSWKELMECKLYGGHSVAAVVPLKGEICILYKNMAMNFIDVSGLHVREYIAGEVLENDIVCSHVLEV